MTKQVQRQAAKQETTGDEEQQEPADLSNAELDKDTDDMLNEIDEALGDIQDSEAWIRGFVQRGGQAIEHRRNARTGSLGIWNTLSNALNAARRSLRPVSVARISPGAAAG
jgi:ubiquitin-like protein Pup